MIIINFFGGSYGHFLRHFLSHNITGKSITKLGDFHFLNGLQVDSLKNIKLTHDDILPSDKFNIKITYHIGNIDLISRLKWQKNSLETPDSFEMFHMASIKKYSYTTRQIAITCFYKLSLLERLDSWNEKGKENVVYIPFDYFLYDMDKWIDNWSKIFKSLNLPVEIVYLKQAHQIFNESQKAIFETHTKNFTSLWKNKDPIAKSNILAQVFFEKHAEKNIPIPIPTYSDTTQMLCEWTKQLDKNNGDLSQLF
jgi:hypothetical protein